MEDKNDILFSKTVKAGHRIYYIDVKQNKSNDMYLCVTESKKVNTGTPEDPRFTYEKHKIFLYREDFKKFQEALGESIDFIHKEKGEVESRPEEDSPIHIDMEF
ncbi:MAG: DUF3276 family protein [Bacteroidaceae bacterium]|nr:DUF3276 family protein [Bacteroidaceae bacterium]